jgi:hypothetical protein
MGTEVAFVSFDDAHEQRLLGELMSMDQAAEGHEIAVDGLAIELQQLGGFGGFDVDAEALRNFSNPIQTQLAVSKHLFRLSSYA